MAEAEDERPCVVVLGSVNVDTFLRVRALPVPGETVIGSWLAETLGGKGANQAIAAARTGTRVVLAGAVGSDEAGGRALEQLRHAGVEVDGVRRVNGPTGRASVWVAESGENAIVVAPEANDRVEVSQLRGLGSTLDEAAVLVVQGELPASASITGITLARARAVRTVVNLAPFKELGDALAVADPLVVNEIEAGQLLGERLDGAGAESSAPRLLAYCRSAVVTLGAAGALVVTKSDVVRVPAPIPRRVADTTGAGDAFVGVLAAALAHGLDLLAAVRQAVEAASESVETFGAGSNYPVFSLRVPA